MAAHTINIDDQILDYAQYLVDEYGQTHDEALENAITTGNSIIALSHPKFGGKCQFDQSPTERAVQAALGEM